MCIKSADYRLGDGAKVDLNKWPTVEAPSYHSSRQYHDILGAHAKELGRQQELLYASNRYALLMIVQGKDGAIAHVMSGVNPQGCRVFSFKQPSAKELKHDFSYGARAASCRNAAR